MTISVQPTKRMPHATLQRRRRDVYARDSFKCVKCGWYPPEVPEGYTGKYTLAETDMRGTWIRWLEVDHVQALSRGGTNDLENLQTLCSQCNNRKGPR